MQFKSFMEALKGKQLDESEERQARADYKVGASGRKSHKEIVFKDAESKDDDKEEMKEAKMSDADMAERERIVKGMKKNLAGFKSRYGDKAKEVMYATATKNAMKEETVDEAVQKADIPAYLRKQQGQTPLKLSDLKRKDTISDKENLAKARNEETQVDEQAPVAPVPDRKYIKGTPEHKAYKATKKPINGMPTNMNKEELELQENHREFAQNGKMHPDMAKHMSVGKSMDYYHPNNGDKVSGKVIKKTDKEVHMKSDHNGKEAAGPVHIFHITNKMDEASDVPFDGPYVKSKPVKNSDGTVQSPMSRARELAHNAIAASRIEQRAKEMMKAKKQVKEETLDELSKGTLASYATKASSSGDKRSNSNLSSRAADKMNNYTDVNDMGDKEDHKSFLRSKGIAGAVKRLTKEAKDEQEYGYEGDMALNQLATLTRCAEMIKDLLKPDTDMPEWVQSKITLATDYIQTAADYMYSEMNEELKGKQHKIDKNKNGKVDAQDFKLLRKESYDADGNVTYAKVSYQDFAMMLEYETKDGRYVNKGTYGGSYVDPEGADDADNKKPKKQPAEKRGRGRPAGAKSGAGKISGTSKLYK